MSTVITDAQCQAFIRHLREALPAVAGTLLVLEPGGAARTIEVAVQGTPVRFSFKFATQTPPRCCINLRPFSTRHAGETAEQKARFTAWVEQHYGCAPKAPEQAPYFKPFGHPPRHADGKTSDVFFDLGPDLSPTRPTPVQQCPEFPGLAEGLSVPLTLLEAMQRILPRLR